MPRKQIGRAGPDATGEINDADMMKYPLPPRQAI